MPDFRVFADESSLVEKPFRIVHRFPGRDLALIKLELSNALFFPIAASVSADDTLFASGSGKTMSPTPAAGKLIRKRRPSAFVTFPQVPGDSGGPVFNQKGELVGITAKLHWGGSLRAIKATRTEIELLDSSKIMTLIKEDRHPSSLSR